MESTCGGLDDFGKQQWLRTTVSIGEGVDNRERERERDTEKEEI